jgi:hypothetical protein
MALAGPPPESLRDGVTRSKKFVSAECRSAYLRAGQDTPNP